MLVYDKDFTMKKQEAAHLVNLVISPEQNLIAAIDISSPSDINIYDTKTYKQRGEIDNPIDFSSIKWDSDNLLGKDAQGVLHIYNGETFNHISSISNVEKY